MTGEFFNRPAPEHQCVLPPVDAALGRDGWRCVCGKAYLREGLSQHGESWWQWRREPALDEAQP